MFNSIIPADHIVIFADALDGYNKFREKWHTLVRNMV